MASQSTALNAASRAPLGLKHLGIVFNACQGCSARWEILGLRLGLRAAIIEEIERDQKKCTDQMREMLSEWLKGNYEVSERYPEPSQHSLCIAVAGIDRSLAETTRNDPSFSDINDTQGSNNSRPPYTKQELMQLCTCTKCDEETIITTGCSDRKDFHALDTKRLSQEQWEVYLGYATEKIQEMKDEWSETYDKISQSISRNDEISVPRLKTKIKTSDWFGKTKEKNSRLKQLNECQDKESIFEVYEEICSWLNHHPLGHLANKFGTENDKQEYGNYVSKTERFLRHSITFFTESCSPDLGGAVTEVKRFRLKVNTELHVRLDGTILPFLRRQVAKLLDIPQMNLYILSLREGCLEVVFSIPEVTYEKYFPLTLDHSRALENLTYEPVGLKFKSIYYSDTWSVKSDEQDASFTDTEGQVIISDPNDTKTDIHVSIPVNHTDNGQTNRNTTKSHDTLCTPDISNGANKHDMVPEDDNDEDNDPFANTGTNLYSIISEQNDTYTELDHIVPQPGRKMHRISVRETANEKPFLLHSPPHNKEKQ